MFLTKDIQFFLFTLNSSYSSSLSIISRKMYNDILKNTYTTTYQNVQFACCTLTHTDTISYIIFCKEKEQPTCFSYCDKNANNSFA